MIKIGVVENNPVSACSYYRSLGPLNKLRYLDKNIEIIVFDKVAWFNLVKIDVLFISRPDQEVHLKMIDMAKNLNIPVWIDWDDNIFHVPDYNPAYKHYQNKSLRENNVKNFLLSDILTVSTKELKNFYEQIAIDNNEKKNVFVVENAHNDYNFPLEEINGQTDSVFWRGSQTHRNDILTIKDSIHYLSKKYIDTTWVFIGDDLWYITDKIDNFFNIKEPIDIPSYYKFLIENKSKIAICPLMINEFNRSKSNISWMEGIFSGSTVLAPKGLPEFDKPGVVLYDPEKSDSFSYLFDKLSKSNSFRIQKYKESFDYIQENLLLSKINKKRLEVINAIRS
jgi:hypothetical protein